ncbi:putative Leo1-like protein [Blattamonas nauphoetae]|uniref:Leo1-like protein n=1 Tax=Blattamonas nauphoetae TaxID=2049346 RepID=A0ABQ9XT90_9EUKA|nr:putative Leo1-like protein [Blattamonas nauphoetae]
MSEVEDQDLEADYQLPVIPPAPQKQLYILKLPTSVGVQPRPFCEEIFREEFQLNSIDRQKRWQTLNLIRWKNIMMPDGSFQRISNARLVTWSDGSLSLFVGKECYDLVHEHSTNQFVYVKRGPAYAAHNRIYGKFTAQAVSEKSSTFEKLKEQARSKYNQRRKVYTSDVTEDPLAKTNQLQQIAADQEKSHYKNRLNAIRSNRDITLEPDEDNDESEHPPARPKPDSDNFDDEDSPKPRKTTTRRRKTKGRSKPKARKAAPKKKKKKARQASDDSMDDEFPPSQESSGDVFGNSPSVTSSDHESDEDFEM